MRTALITICTNRKRTSIPTAQAFSKIGNGSQQDVTRRWVESIKSAVPIGKAEDIYCGRGFQEAKTTASYLHTELMVISAGLGLVAAKTQIPAYGATLSKSAADSISNKIDGHFDAGEWWRQVNQCTKWGSSLSQKAHDQSISLVFITVSSPYLALIIEDLMTISSSALSKVRIIGPRTHELLPERLQQCLMPYDDRFDGPDGESRGTRSDFPQRATRHFVEKIVSESPKASCLDHAGAVRRYLEPMRLPITIVRRKLTDEEVIEAIKEHWDDVSGNSSRMLRLFRDDLLIACEQKRFSTLFNQVKGML